ncbi:MAG: DUF3108 domain-containing protein [Sulfurovaceae bacterium]|nr:DUF3108 domain-containing protein [Sulfurovaceae bacterium]
MKNLFKVFFLLIVTLNVTHAKTINVDYLVEFGIFGEIGVANAVLTQNDTTYEIDIKLEATGVAKTLSGGREEQHISTGHMENGVMVSDMYQVIKSSGSKTTNKVYRIDHVTKTVSKEYQRWKDGVKVKDVNTSEVYSKDDLLTLYFNLSSYIQDKTQSQDLIFTAVGAEKQNGSVTIHIPNSTELKEYKDNLGADGAWYAQAIINQDIFSSDKGELLLSIGDDGITKKAVLKDLIFFGDIRAMRL